MNVRPIPRLLPDLARKVQALYERLDSRIQSLGVGCWVRGACCDFERNPHILYASSLELAFLREKRQSLRNETFGNDSPLCPFWQDGRCTERAGRPLGCRTFFCDPRFRDALQDLYETHYRELQRLAREHDFPWEYTPFVRSVRRGDLLESDPSRRDGDPQR